MILPERRETTLWGLVLADGDRGAGLCSAEPGADSGVGNEASRGKEGEAFRTRPLTARRRRCAALRGWPERRVIPGRPGCFLCGPAVTADG